MIATPHNDHDCLGAITETVAAMVRDRAEALVTVAQAHDDTASLAAWIRSLPQRDDDGAPNDGPKEAACSPAQRLRVPAPDPNCVERAALYLGAAELLDPGPVRRLATVATPVGLHTLPSEDGEAVVLDPQQSRNSLRAGLFHAGVTRNGSSAALIFTPVQAVDWIADLASEPAARVVDGVERVRNGRRAVHGVLRGQPLCIADVRDVALMLALAEREAMHYGPAGPRVVRTTAHAVDRLDQRAADAWKCRNAPSLRVGDYRIKPNVPLLSSLARVGGRITGNVGLAAVRIKLASMGITPPVLNAIEAELQREGLSLGPLAKPTPMLGSLGALTPEAIAGRWIASRF